MPVFARPFGAAGGWLWLLCRKFCSFWLIFGQGVVLLLNRSHATTTPSP